MKRFFIKTIKLDLIANSEKESFQLQQRFSELIRTKLSQKMENIFDKFDGNDQHTIIMDSLILEIPKVEAENLEEDFMEKFSNQLVTKLKELRLNPNSHSSIKVLRKKSKWNSFLSFLKFGFFPWSSNQLSINDLESLIQKETEIPFSLEKLESQIRSDSNSLERLINQLSTSTLNNIFEKISQIQFSFLPIYKLLENTYSKWFDKNEIKLIVWKIAFQTLWNTSPKKLNQETFKNRFYLEVITKSIDYFSNKKLKTRLSQKIEDLIFDEIKSNFINSNIELSESLKKFFQQKRFHVKSSPKENISTKTKNDNMEEIFEEGIFIQNAGLVLLNPYLQMLFDRLGFLEDKNFKSENDQNQAALVLQYLATEKFSSMEQELFFNKILCHIPLEKPIPSELFLDKSQIELCDNLLKAVIQNWGKLGTTSIQGLRESFLNRGGKLTTKENGDWLLQVESKSFDILMSSLPWAISVIKLPWMKQKLMVDWQ